MVLTVRSEQSCFGGTIGFYSHASTEIGATMRILRLRASGHKRTALPVLYYLAGLTCSEETFMNKAGALRLAADLELIVVAPDTSRADLAFRARMMIGISAPAQASISMPRPSPGPGTTACIPM